jgi:hypothetical protein
VECSFEQEFHEVESTFALMAELEVCHEKVVVVKVLKALV